MKNCAPFINCISKIINTQVDNAKDLGIVVPICNLLKYSSSYIKKSGSLWQYCRDEPDDDHIMNFELIKFKSRLTNNTGNASTVNVEIAVPFKCFINFWRTFEMALINCKLTLHLTWSASFIIYGVNRATTLAITDTKLYVPVVKFSTQDNRKQPQKLKAAFKRTIN